MSANMDNRRAAYAITRVRCIDDKNEAQTRKVHASRAIALIRNAGLLKGISFISSNLPEIYQDLLGWLAKSKDNDGPQLPQEVKQAAQQKRIVDYIAGLDSHLQYVRMLKEVVAILEHIKLMAEGQKNYLASLSEATAGDAHV